MKPDRRLGDSLKARSRFNVAAIAILAMFSAEAARAWPIKFYGELSELIEAISSADTDSSAYAEVRSKFREMSEVRLSDDDKWAFFPFAVDGTRSQSPSTLNDMRRNGPEVVLLRVIPDKKGMNRFIYLRLRSPDNNPVKVLPANEDVLRNPSVERAISASVKYGTRRCLKFVNENERAAAKGLYPVYEDFVFESCHMGAYGPPIDASIVRTATFVAEVEAGTQHFAIVMNQDFVFVVKL